MHWRKLMSPRFMLVIVVLAALMPVAVQGSNGHGNRHKERFYEQTNLVSDIPGLAEVTDANLVNAWGISAGPNTPFWISDNGTGLASVYNVSNPASPTSVRVVTIPPPGGSPAGTTSTPTGNIFNPTGDFLLDATHPARFLFATEDGTISGWNPDVDANNAILEVDNSASGAVYKGLAMGRNGSGNMLFATNFRAGTIDVYDATFDPVMTSGSFTDPNLPPCGPALPSCFAPFGIRNIDGMLYVTYALQNAEKHDDVAGPGNGFVDVYDTNGNLVRRLISHGNLNSPWGLAVAPNHFGQFSHELIVGNFGDGHVNAYNIHNGKFRGQLADENGDSIVIDGLWGLSFGNGNAAGPVNTLFFTAGPNDEGNGLFGMLEAEKAGKKDLD